MYIPITTLLCALLVRLTEKQINCYVILNKILTNLKRFRADSVNISGHFSDT